MKAAGPVLFVQFTLEPSGSPISGLMVLDALKEAGFEVHTVYNQTGDLFSRYKEKSVSVSQIEHGRWLAGGPWHRRLRRLLREIAASHRFVELFAKLKPRVVYINNLTGLAPALAARRLKIPCIWHIRELFDDVDGEMHPPWPGGKHLVRYFIARCATRVVVISRAVQENVLGTCCTDRTVLIPNAVDDSFFEESRSQEETRGALGLPLGRPIIGVPGTLRPVKGHEFFLRALAHVRQQVSNVLAAFAGDGDPKYRQSLEQCVADLDLREHVRFLGTITDMPAFYRACDVVCVPSRSESFGRTAIEAMAVGTPVVATSQGGLAETIDNGETGLLSPFANWENLANNLSHVINDWSLVRQLGTAARTKAEQRYRKETYCQRVYGVLAEVIDLTEAHT